MGDLGDSLLGDPVTGGNIGCPTSLSACNAQPVFDRIGVSAEPVSVENGFGEVTDRKEGPFDDDGAFAVGEGEYPVLEVLEVAAKDDTDEFAGVLPLKTPGGDSGDADSACGGCNGTVLAFCKNSGDDCPLMAAEDSFCGSSLLESCVAASAGGGADGSNEKIADLFPIYPMETPIRSLRVEEGLSAEYTETQEGKREADTGAALEENSASFEEDTGVEKCPSRSLRVEEGLPSEYTETQEGKREADTGAALEESASFEEDAGVEKCPSQHLESVVGDSVKLSSDKLTPCSAEEVSASGQACHLTTYVENCLSKLSSNADNVTPACSKPTSIIVFRRSNPKRGASLRSCLSDKKSVQLTGMRNNGNKSGKAADARMSILSRISNKVTKRRSCSQRHRNPSVWGTSDCLLKFIKQSDDLASSEYDAIRIQNKCSKKRRSGKGKKEGQAARKDGRLSVLRCTTTGSSNSLPMKNQKSLHPFFRATASSKSSVRTNLSDRRIHSHLQKRYDDVECKLEKDMNASGINSVEPDGIKSVEPDGLHGDKDLESTLTQDISVESMHGEYPGASSPQESEALAEAIDERRLLDPGTSPDSGVYHPAMNAGTISSACATPTNRDAGMDGGALATEPVAQFGLSTDVSAYSEVHILPTTVSPLDSQVHNNHEIGLQGKKNDEFDAYLCPLSEDLFNEQESIVFKSVSNCAKASEHRRAERRKQEASNEINPLCLESIKEEEAAKGSNYISTQVNVSPHQTIEIGSYEDPIKDEIGLQKRKVFGQNVVNSQLDEGNLAGSSSTDRAKSCRLPRGSKAGDERVSHSPVSMRHRRRNAMGKKKEKIHKSGYKGKTCKKTITDDACKDTSGEMSSLLGVACRSDLTGSIALNSKTSSAVAPETDGKALEKSRNGLEGQPSRPRAAWVLCDDCQKWRCIPAELADLIDETKCKWHLINATQLYGDFGCTHKRPNCSTCNKHLAGS